MKANYLPKNRLRHPYLRRILALVAIFIFGAVVFVFFNATVISIFSPIWKAKNVITTGNEIPSISKERTQENILLELVGRRQEPDMVVASVLTRPPQTPYDVIIIDAGSNESITIGSEVSLPEGPILGVVSEVFSKSAKVKLFSASGEKTNAVLERNNVPVTLIGTGGGNFKLALPRDVAIEKGDRILSPDITSRLLATVGEVSVRPTDSFKEVLAKSPTNIFSLRFVFITP
ncbi:MAG: rod shape-determining protein MreC [Patescibacteria group bacterium]|nr:rod shape-determining protein MreC [Patescibacteria group bacterium]